MYLKGRKSSTDPRLRSLLQKAVRRGAEQIVHLTILKLMANGDKSWLRSRAVVITFEESWPLAQDLSIAKDLLSKETALLMVSRAKKQKDAAGLGALAFAFHEGDKSMLDIVPSRRSLILVSEAIKRPDTYFDWLFSQCTSEESKKVVKAASRYLAAATWGWDKATILAGAYLAVSNEVPPISASRLTESSFPYWIALDKHTPEGKKAFRSISSQFGVPYRHLIWASFYYESAIVNDLYTSVWFDCERNWRLRKAGMTETEAEKLWINIRSMICQELEEDAEKLRAQVECQSDQIRKHHSEFDGF